MGAFLLIPGGCTRGIEELQDPPHSVAETTSGAWASMVYLARTDSGLIAIDLGWTGAKAAIERGTRRLGGTPNDVRYAFLTHAHRDHISGWRAVPRARFILGRDEVPYFAGSARYSGIVPSRVERITATDRPDSSAAARVLAFGRDTVLALGRDSLWAFAVPGHTPGSAAYLFRGVLFGGDAVNYRPLAGFRGARSEMSEDVAKSRASLHALLGRLDSARVRFICSAHAKCARNSHELRSRLLR
ncbi:MAG: MBL fold metallo-hydrolase [Gemmatimonadaceae bacterium]